MTEFLYLAISLGIQLVLFIPAFFFKTDKLTDFSYALTFIILAVIAAAIEQTMQKIVLAIVIILWALRLGIYLVIRIHAIGRDKRFDKIRSNPLKFLGFWLLQGTIVWVVSLPIIVGTGTLQWVGVVIWTVGLFIESIADHQKFVFKLQNKKDFISSGVWKYSRHPNYFGEILCWVGIFVAVVEPWWILISPLSIYLILRFGTGIPQLEKKYDERYKDDKKYQEYKKNTALLIPFLK